MGNKFVVAQMCDSGKLQECQSGFWNETARKIYRIAITQNKLPGLGDF